MKRTISNENQILTFFHCRLCLGELPENESPQTYARYEMGYSRQGLQVWCLRHDCNVIHIDFEGVRHPANLTRKKEEETRVH